MFSSYTLSNTHSGGDSRAQRRNVCPSSWNLDYMSYLMSNHLTHKRSQFICVDSDPETTIGTHANLNGALLYVVEAHCSSLPCQPYIQGAELNYMCSLHKMIKH